MDGLLHLAGIAFDPHIRGVLVVLTGVVVLGGSIYLIVGTNVGARLGFLVSIGALAGWMFILGLTWFISPPAIGPRGAPPSWEAIDIVRGSPTGSSEEVVRDLPYACFSSTASDCIAPEGSATVSAQLLSENPEFVEAVGDDATLSEIAVVDEDGATDLDYGGWDLLASSEAGEAQAAADATLKELDVFTETTDYLLLDTFVVGGKGELADDPTRWDRLKYKFDTATQLTHPPRYAVVQLQAVIPQETEPGEAPPSPALDVETPVISVVMVRELGNLRMPAALVMAASGLILFSVAYVLHQRDKLSDAHQAAAAAD
jgi:hypothetical protein